MKSAGRLEGKVGGLAKGAGVKASPIHALSSIDQNYSYKGDGLLEESQISANQQFKSNHKSEMNSISHNKKPSLSP